MTDQELDAAEQAMEREKALEAKVREEFRFCALPISDQLSAVNFVTPTEVCVTLELTATGYDINRFIALAQSGIGRNFKIDADSDACVTVTFTVNE